MSKTKIKVERSKLDWTQDDLAEKVCVSRQTISNIEKGKCKPTLCVALRIAETFGLKIEDFVEFSNT